MAIRKIIQMGNPILRNVAAVIDNPRSDDIVQLSEDLKDTLVDINGRGIAAPQIGVSKSIFVADFSFFEKEENFFENELIQMKQVFINPSIIN